MTRERAIEMLEEIAERESEYVASQDYASNMDDFAREENFMYACIYDKYNRYSCDARTNMYDDTYNVHTLTEKYGFHSVEDMVAYVFDRCEPETEYNSAYCSYHPNTMLFTSVPVGETELYIDRCDHEELFDYLVTLTEEERADIFSETDLVYHKNSWGDEITSFTPTLYHGGTISFFTSLPNAIQILESKE